MRLVLLLLLRNIWRHKLRSGLTFFTIFFATILAHLYVGGQAALDTIFNAPFFSGTAFVKGLGAPIVATLPNSYAEEIRQIPGITAATNLVMYGMPAAGGRTDWLIIGVEPTQFRAVAGPDLDSIPAADYEKFAKDPSTFLLSRGAITSQGWKVGDVVDIPLSLPEADGNLPAGTQVVIPPNTKISGRFVGVINKGIFSDRVIICHASALEKLLNWYRGGGVIAKFSPGVNSEVIGHRIEQTFNTSGRERVDVMMLDLWVEGVKTFVSQLSTAMLFIIGLLGLLALVIMIFNVSMAGVDLLPQVGTLRSIGLSRAEALVILGGEGMLMTFGSAAFATFLIYFLTTFTHIIDLSSVDEFLAPVFTVTARGTFIVLGVAFVLGFVGSILPFLRPIRSSVVELRARR